MTDLIMYKINEEEKEKKFMELCKKLGLHTRRLKDSDANISISVLNGNGKAETIKQKPGLVNSLNSENKISDIKKPADKKKSPGGYKIPEVLIFSGISDNKLDEFLAEYKKMQIEPVGLKAVVTIHNINWSLYELIEELIKERAMAMFSNRN